MSVAGPAGLEIASLRRRGLALLIDLGVIVPPLAIAGVAAAKLYKALRGRDPFASGPTVGSWRRQLAFVAASAPIEVALRNRRRPGARVLGLRRVDARTGGPVSVRSAVIHTAVEAAWSVLNRRVRRPFTERVRAAHAELDEMRRSHGGELEPRQRMDVYKRHGVRPASSLGRTLLDMAPPYLAALWSPRNQTLPDRVAGIVVVRD